MTGLRGRGRDRAELHSLAGAYALNAVSAPDQARFERHLAGCEQCRLEVRGFGETAARLGASQAVRPRPELRDQALRTAARTRQLPPGPRLRTGWAQSTRHGRLGRPTRHGPARPRPGPGGGGRARARGRGLSPPGWPRWCSRRPPWRA